MEIRELMTPHPEACLPTDSCAVAGEIMRRRMCGFVPVVESHQTKRVVGVVTDRDLLLHVVAVDRAPSQVRVDACMTRAVEFIAPSAGLEDAARIMETAAIHRLPVVDDGRLIGILSLKDIALAARKQWAYAGPHAAERQLVDIVEAIAAAR